MRRPLCVFCVGTLGLELVCAFLPQMGLLLPFAAFFVAGLLWLAGCRLSRSPSGGCGLCLVLGAAVGLVLMAQTNARLEAVQTAHDGRIVLLEAEVEQVDRGYRPDRVSAVLRVRQVDGRETAFRVECASLPRCKAGDRVRGVFALEVPAGARQRELYADGVALSAEYQRRFVRLGPSTSFRARTARLQTRLSAALRQGMAPDQAGVLAAMVVGDRSVLSSRLRKAYRGAGLSHVLVVSGMHVSILCGQALESLTPRRDRRKLRSYASRRFHALLRAGMALLLVGVTGITPSVLRAAAAVWIGALGVWVYGPPDALTSLGVAGVLMTAGNSYAICDIGFELSFAAVLGTLAGGECVRRSRAAWEMRRSGLPRKTRGVAAQKTAALLNGTWETLCISACASAATFPVLVLRGLSASLYALVSGAAVLWLVEPILLTGLGAALLGLVPFAAPAQRLCSWAAEGLTGLLDRWALWVSGWPGAQLWFETPCAAVVCLLLVGLCWLALHYKVRLRVALPTLLVTAAIAIGAGSALGRDIVRVELVGSRNAPAVVITRNSSAVVLFRGGDSTRNAVEAVLEKRNIRTVECLVDLRLKPESSFTLDAEQRLAADRMPPYLTCRVPCGPAELEVLRTRTGCIVRIQAAGQSFVTLSGSVRLARPVCAGWLLASASRPDAVEYAQLLTLSEAYRWMEPGREAACHSCLALRPDGGSRIV